MNHPLGVFQYYNRETDTTHVQWSYVEDDAVTHFEIEVYDENLRKWVKFDNRNGIVPKAAKKGVNY